MPTIAEIIAAKKAAATAPPVGKSKPAGIILSKDLPPQHQNGEPRGQKTPIPDEIRSLSEPRGQGIDMTPVNASPMTTTWHQAMNAFQTELCIMQDPERPDQAWIAVKMAAHPPILLHCLPLWEHPTKSQTQPF